MKYKFRRVACFCLTAVMSVSLAAGNALAFADSKSLANSSNPVLDTVDFKNVTGSVDLSGVALQNLSPTVLENTGYTVKDETRTVIVSLDDDCIVDKVPEGMSVAEYLGSYSGSRALSEIKRSQDNFLTSLASLGVSYQVVYQYSTVTNAVAIQVNTANLSKIKGITSVKSAAVSETYAYPEAITTQSSGEVSNPNNVYATGIYDSSKYVDMGYDGSGMTVAVLDTGIDYTHEAFSTMPEQLGLNKTQLRDLLATKNFKAVDLSAAKGQNIGVDDLYINDKIPFAYDYADHDTNVYPGYSQHGVHVAGIVAGEADSYKNKEGEIAKDDNGDEIPFRGVAPKAQLVICKVFTDDFDNKDLGGATSEDIIAALEDCVLLGVDVINMSLGTSAGFSSLYLDGDDEGKLLADVYHSVKERGISLVCAASNEFSSGYGSALGTNAASNPDSGTVGSPSTFEGALSVASINGQLAPFMVSNAGEDEESVIYYLDSSDENMVQTDFRKLMLGDKASATYKYVVVPGYGNAGNYTASIKREFTNKGEYEKVIAVISRGSNTFADKVEIAQRMGADGVIVYNNVAGTIRMSLGELDNPIPAVSVSLDAGRALIYNASGKTRTTGTIELNTSYQAGPFMNDYSSWGTTPDLKIKPEITAHGGEITSAVSGGWAEQSGTSMASPNMAGFIALLRAKLKAEHPDYTATQLVQLINQIVMSTAVTVYDEDGKPYSPRKQGAGLATLENVFTTNAYLYTLKAEDNRPKVELGDDKQKTGVYTLEFYVMNTGDTALKFKANSIFMTETLDGLAVAEKAYILDDIPAVWKLGNQTIQEGEEFSVNAGTSQKLTVTLTLSDAEKKYLDESFVNGMFVEGFLQLISATDGQCSLNLPFMGFYGDWEAAPMLDYDVYEIAQFKQDTSYDDETRPTEKVWATQAYAIYNREKYTVPMGGYVYLQDESAEQIYADPEHAAISRYDIYYGEDSLDNYQTTTAIKALYAGLLRNAEVVTYSLYNDETGELILSDCVYRANKAVAGGGSATPSQILLEMYPEETGLINNGKYRLDFNFYFKEEYKDDPTKQNEDNTFSMVFYVDYEAPVLVDTRIRYYDYKENNQDKQRVYLDLDIYDNHYAQAVVLCYADYNSQGVRTLYLATEYVTPVLNAVKNGTTTVSIDITEFYQKYQNRLYVQIDDYALNHSVYQVMFSSSTSANLPDSFEIVGDTEITLDINETYKVMLDYAGDANISNFTWESSFQHIAQVKNGEIVGVSQGTAYITVTGASGSKRVIKVNVTDKVVSLNFPTISFGTIEDSAGSLTLAAGTVSVNAGEQIKLEIVADPWYYPVDTLKLKWSTTDSTIADVDPETGTVSTFDKKGIVSIRAAIMNGDTETAYAATVTFNVQENCTISSNTLTAYHGTGGTVILPADKNITAIGTEAFKDNDNIKVLVIPKTVMQIGEGAFKNCTALEEVYFIQEEAMAVPDSALAMILKYAFQGCTALRKIDFTNCKKVTLASEVFAGCTALEEIVGMDKLGTLNARAFYGCTSLKTADLTGTFVAGESVFENCTSIDTVITSYYSAIGTAMFRGCTSITEVTINTPVVGAYAFADCSSLAKVNFGGNGASAQLDDFVIGEYAFFNCISLNSVNFNSYNVTSIGSSAFSQCSSLKNISLPAGTVLGDTVFFNSPVTVTFAGDGYETDVFGTIYCGTELVLAPKTITSEFTIREGTLSIAANAFSGSKFQDGVTLDLSGITSIGESAFIYSGVANVILSEQLTSVAPYAFAWSALENISIPDAVTEIGEYAFAYCSSLERVAFDNSSLSKIGSCAFAMCTSLTQITLPDGVKTMGDRTFFGCTLLKTAVMPSVETLGNGTFANCPALTTVTFGSDASTTGENTFANAKALESVTLGNKTTEIGSGVFYNSGIQTVDLNNVTKVGSFAFGYCTNLTVVTGIENLTYIGAYAFADVPFAGTLKLEKAEYIGEGAFMTSSGTANYTALEIPSAVEIGADAFYGGSERIVAIPESLKVLGGGAFSNSKNLVSFTVKDNKTFFTDNGVLYRIISGTAENGEYEVCAYPANKPAALSGLHKTYAVLEGTVSVQDYAFSELSKDVINEIILPYSIKTIGNGAFYASGISSYVFESIAAPVLLTEFVDRDDSSTYSVYYTNFERDLFYYVNYGITSYLKISYPSNGTGYTNFIFSSYFGNKVLLGELMDDTTRALKAEIESFATPTEVAGWLKLENNAANKTMVSQFSDSVKAAHMVYNSINSDKQLEYLGTENIEKLLDIETELKAVKAYFGIAVAVSSLSVSADSTHKTEYKAGEKFDMTGLKLVVTYDDYSTEDADMSKVTVAAGSDGELATYDRFITLSYQGRTVEIAIKVTDDSEIDKPAPTDPSTGDETTDTKQGNDNTVIIVVCSVIGGLLVIGAVAAAVVVLKIKKSKKAPEEKADGASEEEK